MDKSLTVSKLDAAKRQLEVFIRLYFNSGDPVAMHTLVAAAFGVIRDLNKRRGGDPTLHESIFQNVKPEHHKLLRDKLTEAQNFFKHADRDHSAMLEFNPDSTEFMALDACSKYWELTGELPPLFQIFRSWMMLTNQEIFILPKEQLDYLESAAKTFVPKGKVAYFNDMLSMVMKSGT
ncbi:hypothetical protein [Nitrosomonas sp. Nm166]|uniref:hypothetical protein n=1 Tax=Nitrosomonas sp. Nm166 TaxID=1881054 RepID=UPI0008E105FD|nr:hypothetical protein [Nitrosomonas sp. Nm166]SFD84281.1 hypothetical protein SAMN05428977_100114 [Nitrosomonas sp. Nm166]